MKKIIITGATGFVGGALAKHFAGAGWDVTGVKRPSSTQPADLEISWVDGDVTEASRLSGIFHEADFVIHAAGMLGEAGIPESAYQQLHVDGTKNVLNAIEKQAPNARILYVSSPGVLGPIDGSPADETTPLAPSNPYERSKAKAEALVREYAGQGLDIVIARPEFIYGPHDAHVLGLFSAIQRGLFFYIGNGRSTCHPTFIDDAVRGMALCLEKGQSGEIYHITGPTQVTFKELGETIANAVDVHHPWIRIPKPIAMIGAWCLELLGSLLGRTPPLSRTGVAFFSENRAFSWQKARALLEYTPQNDLATGVQKTVTWYRQQGWL
ncbi:MAG: NAD-dependent epimerase/dehydratase family protein [Chloroflexota bacterium]